MSQNMIGKITYKFLLCQKVIWYYGQKNGDFLGLVC